MHLLGDNIGYISSSYLGLIRCLTPLRISAVIHIQTTGHVTELATPCKSALPHQLCLHVAQIICPKNYSRYNYSAYLHDT